MRPGQTAPECHRLGESERFQSRRFNEAGADCPGMPSDFRSGVPVIFASFNEAGADCPGMLQ